MTTYLRYVAIGDSQTEGLGDGDETSGYRGWADRLAEQLAHAEPEFTYANLAVRGRQAAQIRAGQLAPALALRPDLVSVMAGMNDVVRPGFRPEPVAAEVEAMFAELTGAGAHVLTFTFPDLTRLTPALAALRPRLTDFNGRLLDAAARHGVTVVDASGSAVTVDPRMWSSDRLHASPAGHARIARAAAEALALPGSDASWRDPLPPLPPLPAWRRTALDLAWAGSFLGPWAWRRLTGRSSGDGRHAKRPEPTPVHAVSARG
ncbi:SGNH/GDSL hydrolase family protein [Streptomyces sp. NPDC050145]|uniref:SGNH/GDSL hydrolase family protein n=1 Tax=Streptomyces sp. NPDC050145 TaxID=3365602 RepID=UPI0037A5DE91